MAQVVRLSLEMCIRDSEPADGGGDQPGLEGGAGGERDAEGQRQGDQEDRDGRGHIGTGEPEATRTGGWRTVGLVGVLGPGGIGGAGGDAG